MQLILRNHETHRRAACKHKGEDDKQARDRKRPSLVRAAAIIALREHRACTVHVVRCAILSIADSHGLTAREILQRAAELCRSSESERYFEISPRSLHPLSPSTPRLHSPSSPFPLEVHAPFRNGGHIRRHENECAI